jgi:hypothetical protein
MTWLWLAPWKGALHDSAQHTYGVLANGSERVMEYWKNENLTPIFYNLEQKPSRFSDA